MPEIEVIVFDQKLKLSYQDDEKQRLINAVETLNKRWSKFADLLGKVSDKKIITLISIDMQDSIEDFQILKNTEVQSANKIELLQKEIISKNVQLEENLEKIKKYETDLNEKNYEISKVEMTLDELNIKISNIKNNILKNQDD